MLDCPRRWNGGEGRSQQVAKRRRDRLILHALLPQRSKPEGRSGRPAERGRETRDDLVSEEDSLDGNGCEVLKVSRALLGDENNGQERMLSLDVSQDAENGWEIWSFEYDCVSVTGKPPQFLLVAVQHNPDLKRKYEALVTRGKPPKVALTAVMRKLLILANALVQQDRIWTPHPPREYSCPVFPTPCQVGSDHA